MRIQLNWFNEKLAARLADLAAGRVTPAPPRDAATIMVLRTPADGSGVEILMLRRTAAMKFAPGAYVFPGGSVDPADYGADIGWQGPSAGEFGARLGASAEVARALVCAAVRETFEETGVLFAGPSTTTVVTSTADEGWEADRHALETRELALTELLTRRSLVLRTDLLGAWSRWVTPEFEPRRYDTAFFIAALPTGQHARDVSGEAESTVWTTASRAIADHAAGSVSMLPPTVTTLREIAAHATTGSVFEAAAGRSLKPIMADVERHEDGSFWLVWPAGMASADDRRV